MVLKKILVILGITPTPTLFSFTSSYAMLFLSATLLSLAWMAMTQQQSITKMFICNPLGNGLHHQRHLHTGLHGQLLHKPTCWVSTLKYLLSLKAQTMKISQGIFSTRHNLFLYPNSTTYLSKLSHSRSLNFVSKVKI